jgi:hypothetical protein
VTCSQQRWKIEGRGWKRSRMQRRWSMCVHAGVAWLDRAQGVALCSGDPHPQARACETRRCRQAMSCERIHVTARRMLKKRARVSREAALRLWHSHCEEACWGSSSRVPTAAAACCGRIYSKSMMGTGLQFSVLRRGRVTRLRHQSRNFRCKLFTVHSNRSLNRRRGVIAVDERFGLD